MCGYPGCTELTSSYYCRKHQKAGGTQTLFKGTERRASQPYNHLYHCARWKRERKAFLEEHPFCTMCGEKASVVDHIRPHHGIEEIFWNHSNWQSLCLSCHSRKTLEENNFFHK